MARHILILFSIIAILFGCDNIKYRGLYNITDEFVEELQTTYESYGLLGGMEHEKYTKDGEYKVLPIGRLINVRIERIATDDEYESLRKALESHYSNNPRVNQVYRSKGGTLMIDCRTK